jgi:hypothetical protein
VQAVARELVRGDIIAEVAGLCPLGHQVSDEVAEPLMRSRDVLTLMQERRKLSAVVLLVGDERVGLEHPCEPLAGAAGLVPDLDEAFEVAG